MLAIKHRVVIIVILFSPLSAANDLTSQLHTFSSAQFAGVSDEARVPIRTVPNLLPPCEQPSLSMSDNSRPQDNMNMSARCGNDERYLQANVQATGNYMIAVMPIVQREKLEAGNVKLKCGRLDTLPPRTVLDINQLADVVSLCDLSPDQPIQLIQFRQVWRVEARQHVNVVVSDYGVSANAEGQVLDNVAVVQNMRARMVSGQVINGVADADGNILINPQAVKGNPSLADG